MNADSNTSEIGLDQAAAGMILASALLDANGSVLLPQDAALTDGMLASLRRRGIERCVVRTAAEPVDPAVLARERERRLQRLEHLFRHRADGAGSLLLLERLRAYRGRQAP
ncbi:hypothetical protein ACEN9F_28710 [Duganella sp. CT11-25]|uniref:hypothetical protein n=1 Tax=unclassified Duganella TaxID=2636909 RepID=UPI0039B05C0A